MGNKFDDKTVKPNPVSDGNLRDVEEIIIPPEKGEEILNIRKMEYHKISKLLNY